MSPKLEQQLNLAGSQRKIKSAFMVAVAAFLALNCLMSFFTPLPFDEFKFPYRGWAWWTMNDLRQKPGSHNLALLGSSLMVSAIGACDAIFLKSNLDLTAYHKAAYLDHKLRTKYSGSFDTFDLSAPGQMPSDAYLALKAMVTHGNRPEVVVYGVAPRDFIDSTLSDPADTEQFKYFNRLVDIRDVSNHYFRSPLAKLDWWLQRNVYLYGTALDFHIAAVDAATTVIDRVLPRPAGQPQFTWWDRVRLMPKYLPAEMHPAAIVTSPVDFKTASATYVDNTKEYLDRYRSPDPYTYKTQMFFLNKIAQFCRKERIELVLVNMPITFYNASMLEPGIYAKYILSLKQLADKNKVSFYNLADFNQFKQPFFHDSVHMNGYGGMLFIDKLVDAISADRQVSSAMAMAGKELQRQEIVARKGVPSADSVDGSAGIAAASQFVPGI